MKAYKAIEGTETHEKYGDDIIISLIIEQEGFPRSDVRMATADELIDAIDDDPDNETGLLEMLCEMVDINPDDYRTAKAAYRTAILINVWTKWQEGRL